jgi:probable phosphoglycerate mutase
MKTYPRIWFLRHGQTEWNRAFRLQGQQDSPLTAQGREDARRQAVIMRPVMARGPDVFVSPLGRARQTADIALAGAPYQTDPRLMEIGAGTWQGRLRDDILAEMPDLAARHPSALDIYAAAPDGEGFEAFRARIIAFLDALSAPSVIVAHGLLGQVLRGHLRGLERDAMGALPNGQGCVYLLENGAETLLDRV